MFEPNLKPSDKLTVLAKLDPVSQGAATITSAWLSAGDYAQYLAIIMLGVMAGTSTVDAKLQQASDSGGTGAKDITGSPITQFTQAGGDSGKTAFIQFDPRKGMDADNNFTHFRLSITVAAAASLLGYVIAGMDPKYGVGVQIAGVAQTVSVF